MDFAKVVDAAVAGATADPVAFDVPLPEPGGYRLTDLRAACRAHGETVFTAQGASQTHALFLRVTIDRRVPARDGYLAVNLIARDDAPGLARAIQSALEYVDEVVVGVDGRSDEATRKVAEVYADIVAVFGAADLGMTEGEWLDDKIHFAKARNHSRELVKAPWVLVIDADELFSCTTDLCRFLRHIDATEGDRIGGVLVPVGNLDHTIADAQRLARTRFRYRSAMHNQLAIDGEFAKLPDNTIMVLHEGSLRPETYTALRAKQRADGVEKLVVEGKNGNMSALFHAAKHLLGEDAGPGDERGVALAEDFRLRIEPHDKAHAVERVYLAIYAALYFQGKEDLARAEMWAVRALLDGPNVDAFVLLGMLAFEQQDIHRARLWYECACACEPDNDQFAIHQFANRRFVDRDALRRQLMKKPNEREGAAEQ